jgi:hypothetical protein
MITRSDAGDSPKSICVTRCSRCVSMGVPAVAGVVEGLQSCHGGVPALGVLRGGVLGHAPLGTPARCPQCAVAHTAPGARHLSGVRGRPASPRRIGRAQLHRRRCVAALSALAHTVVSSRPLAGVSRPGAMPWGALFSR